MISDIETIFVWIYLPNQIEPTLCGRATRAPTAADVFKGEFVYQKNYLLNPRAVPIDPVLLPLETKVFETTTLGGIFSAILDAGPDSWGQREIENIFGSQTAFGYLLHSTGDQIGALAFSAEPSFPPNTKGTDGFPYIQLENLLEAAHLLESNQPIPQWLLDLLRVTTSAGGARPKATLLHEGSQWLAKFPSRKDSENLPSNPKLEKTALDLAELAGIAVPKRKLVTISGKDVLLVERFDRHYVADGGVEGWARRRYVSARTVFYSRPDVQKYAITGSYQRLSKELSTWSNQTQNDRTELFRRIVFNCLVNNTDDHDQNHGFVDSGNGFLLSPAFDIVPQPPAGARSRLALNIGEFGGEASRENLLSEYGSYGITFSQASAIIDSIKSVVAGNWERVATENGVAPIFLPRIQTAFCANTFELEH